MYHRQFSQQQTTRAERLLLSGAVAILPAQFFFPKVGGLSIAFILFGVLASYLILWRSRTLKRTLLHPVFLAGYAFLGTSFFMELVHGDPHYVQLSRIFLMFVGAILIASLCRDRRAIFSAIFGLVLSSLVMSILLIYFTYGAFSGTQAHNFQEATTFREELYVDNPMNKIDANQMGFFSGQGAVVALVLAVTTRSAFLRYGMLISGVICLVAAFMPMSRGAVMILFLTGAAVFYAYGIFRPKVLASVGIIAICLLVMIPDAIFSRFAFSLEGKHSGTHVEGRSRIYSAVIKNLPEYYLIGVGISQYYGKWGRQNGFHFRGHVFGTHNTFAQVLVFWGLPGLFALLVVLWQVYRYLPTPRRSDPVYLCLIGISLSVLLESLVVHTFYGKEFSIALGLLVACSQWNLTKKSSQGISQEEKKAIPDSSKWPKGVPVTGVHH